MPTLATRRGARTNNEPTTARAGNLTGTSTARHSASTATGKAAKTGVRAVGPTTTTRPAPPPEPAPQASNAAPEGAITTPPAGLNERLASYFLVDSAEKFQEIIGPSLILLCRGHAIAVQLEGRMLGAEDGEISIIKVGQVTCRT